MARGMFKPKDGKPFDRHMLLFHNERRNPYGDEVEDGRIRYVGEGKEEDQEVAGNNATLARHLELGVHVHYFTQPRDSPGQVRYDGEVVVENWRSVYREADRRVVLQFDLVPVASRLDPIAEYDAAAREGLEVRPPRLIERRRAVTLSERIVRAAGFNADVLAAYDEECAVCGTPLKSGSSTELEAAHIAGAAAGGPEEVPNGLCLCRRHHWAFDHGVFSLTDSHEVIWLAPTSDPHEEIAAGQAIQRPESQLDWPDPFYLAIHRQVSQVNS